VNAHLDSRVEHYGPSLEDASRVAVVVHGRAQDPEWIRAFILDRLERDDLCAIAPEAADNSWYPGVFMDDTVANEPHLTWALERIDRLVTDLEERGLDRSDLYLLGFSQGACLIAEYVSRNPARYGGVAILTGGLIGPPGTQWPGGSFDGTPVLIATSDVDDWVPIERIEETRTVFESRGADVTWRVYPGMGHIINDDEVRLVDELLNGSG
jgi:predicted esterase